MPRPSWPETLHKKSPIFSPDVENGRGSLDFPVIVRDAPDEIPRSALASKSSLSPESRDSPRIRARQKMTSPDPGGLSDSTSRRKSGVSEYPRQSALQKARSNRNEKAKRSSHSTVISLGPAPRTLSRSSLIPGFWCRTLLGQHLDPAFQAALVL
jgi:hypothetical protein